MRPKVIKVREGEGDRLTFRKDKGKHVEGEVPFCRSCVNLLYLDGIVRCAEFDFLLKPDDIKSPIDCPKYLPLNKIKSFKIFTGVANKMHVMEELVHEAVIRTTVTQGRGSTLLEVSRLLATSKKTALHVLRRLESSGKVRADRTTIVYPTATRRKAWRVNIYFPKLLEGKVEVKDG